MAKIERLVRDEAIIARYLEGNTLGEVGKEFNISDERVRQILAENGHKARKPGPKKSLIFKPRQTVLERFKMKVHIQESDPYCWIWDSKSSSRPRFSYTQGTKKVRGEYANRSARWLFLGVQSEGKLQSVCKNDRCVHPLHWLPK